MVGMSAEGTVGGLWLGGGGLVTYLRLPTHCYIGVVGKNEIVQNNGKLLVLPQTNNRKITPTTNNKTDNKQPTTLNNIKQHCNHGMIDAPDYLFYAAVVS